MYDDVCLARDGFQRKRLGCCRDGMHHDGMEKSRSTGLIGTREGMNAL
jgi:hypothetical protein